MAVSQCYVAHVCYSKNLRAEYYLLHFFNILWPYTVKPLNLNYLCRQ